MMWMLATSAMIGRCPWSIRVQIHGWRCGKLLYFVLFNMARGFENAYEIILDLSKWKPRKKISRSYLQRKKMEKRRQNLKKTLYNLRMPKLQEIFTAVAIVLSLRDSLFCKMFSPLFCVEQEKTLPKKFSKKLYTYKTKSSVWDIKNA